MSKTLRQNVAPREIANKFAESLLFCNETGSYYKYNESKRFFEEMTNDEVTVMILDFVEENYDQNITTSMIKGIENFLRVRIHRKEKSVFTPYIALLDKVLDTRTWTFHEHDRFKYPCFFNLPYSYEQLQNAPTPTRFLQFLDEVLVDPKTKKPDKELQLLIQQVAGYLLQGDLTGYKVFFFLGSGANGKSILLNIFTQIVGDKNTTSSTLQQLTASEFGISAIIGKKLNLCSEDDSKHLKSDNFKRLVDGSKTTIRKIYEAPFDYYPQTKYLFAINEMVRFLEINKGLRRRICIIPFNSSFDNSNQDKTLQEKLFSELPGIIRWAILGGRRFMEAKHNFVEPKQCKQYMDTFTKTVSSAIEFVETCLKPSEVSTINTYTVYNYYRLWCSTVGRKPLAKINFEQHLSQLYPNLLHNNLKEFKVEVDREYCPPEVLMQI